MLVVLHKRQAIGLNCLHKNAQLLAVSQSIGVRVRTIKFLQKTVIAEKILCQYKRKRPKL